MDRLSDLRIVSDPVHGVIRIPQLLFDGVIDDPLYQRLRSIKQLALTYYVYPGAVHTRFEHSLGVAHVADKILEGAISNTRRYILSGRTWASPSDVECLSHVLSHLEAMRPALIAAALLHDAGHQAYSHNFEMAQRDLLLVLNNMAPGVRASHEMVSIELATLFQEKARDRCIKDVLSDAVEILKYAYDSKYRIEVEASAETRPACPEEEGQYRRYRYLAISILASMIDSPLDADRLDFLYRDSYYSGNPLGYIDINRIYNIVVIVPYTDGDGVRRLALGITEKGSTVLESTLLARQFMYNTVYLHPVSMGYDGMQFRLTALLYLVSKALEDMGAMDSLPGTYRNLFNAISMGFENPIELARHESGRLSLALVDPLIDTVTSEIARGEAPREVYDAARSHRVWGDSLCLALALASRGIAFRRHWSYLMVEGQAAVSISRKLRSIVEGRARELDVDRLRTLISPMVILNYEVLKVYDSGEHRVYTITGSEGRAVAVDVIESGRAPILTTLDAAKGFMLSKIMILHPSPDTGMGSQGWTEKRGKITVADIEEAARICRISMEAVEDLLSRAREDSYRLASTLLEAS
ncbi:MAG: HD domain-containing protein [Desulfurococcales archaeon]|nr:HD domain-containing protein [Desulfurococcales archaeon]